MAWGLLLMPFGGQAQEGISAPIDTQIERARRFDSNPLLAPQISDVRQEEEMVLAAPATPGDDDLGQQLLLQRREQYKAFRVFGDFTTMWTNNVTLLDENPQSDGYLVGTVGGTWQPILTRNLVAEVTVAQQFFRYFEFSALDFNSLNAGAGLTYIIDPLDGLAASLRYNFNRLTDTDGDEFYKVSTVSFGLQKPWVISSAQLLFVGFSANFDFSDPAAPQRDTYALYGGYQVDLTRSLTASVFYQLALYDYNNIDRQDLNNTVSLGASYKFTEWLRLGAVVSGGFNNSSLPVFNYDVFNGGGNLLLEWRF